MAAGISVRGEICCWDSAKPHPVGTLHELRFLVRFAEPFDILLSHMFCMLMYRLASFLL